MVETYPSYFYPSLDTEELRDIPIETPEEAQGNDTLIHYGFSIGGWSPGKYASKAADWWEPGKVAGSAWEGVTDTAESVTNWHPGEFAGQAYRWWEPGKILGGISGGIGNVAGGIGDIFGETAKTASFMMWTPIILIGVVLFVAAILIVVKISKSKKKDEEEG